MGNRKIATTGQVSIEVLVGRQKDRWLNYASGLAESLGITSKYADIEITFSKNIDGAEEQLGYCDGDKDYVEIAINTHDKGVKLSMKEQAVALAHEFVHARQFLKGQLSGDGTVWKGKKTNLPYEKQPWEIEARKLEYKLYEENKHLLD